MEVNCEECLRLTVGTPEQNDEFLQKVREVLASEAYAAFTVPS